MRDRRSRARGGTERRARRARNRRGGRGVVRRRTHGSARAGRRRASNGRGGGGERARSSCGTTRTTRTTGHGRRRAGGRARIEHAGRATRRCDGGGRPARRPERAGAARAAAGRAVWPGSGARRRGLAHPEAPRRPSIASTGRIEALRTTARARARGATHSRARRRRRGGHRIASLPVRKPVTARGVARVRYVPRAHARTTMRLRIRASAAVLGRSVRPHRRGDGDHLRPRYGVMVPIAIEDVARRAIHIIRRRIDIEPHDRARMPVIRGRHRGPANVSVTGIARLPGDPRGRVPSPGDPHPAARFGMRPAAVVKDDPAEAIVVVADPEPLLVLIELPVASRLVGGKVAANPVRSGHPNRAVRRVLLP